MPPLSERIRTRGWSWLLDVALAVAVGWVMSIGWVAVATPDHMGMGRGRMPPEVDLQWSPTVQGAVAAVAVAVVVSRVLPRSGWLLGLAGVAGYLASGGSPVAAVVAAIVLGTRLLMLSPSSLVPSSLLRTGARTHADDHPSQAGLARQWPWLLALVPAYLTNGLGDGHPWVSLFTTATMLVWTTLPLVAAAAFLARRGQRVRERALELEGVARAERLRLARDIHDVVGHSLSLISLQSGVALRVLDNDPAQARRSLEAIRQTSKQALAEVRTTLGVFRESDEAPLAPTPGLVAMERLVQQVASSGASITCAELPDPSQVPAGVQSVAHRVVQEAVTNALRHAPGAPITVVAVVVGGDLRVRVADSGAPALPIREGNGLTGMRERVRAIGGTMTIEAGAAGFAVMATLPLQSASPTWLVGEQS
jgi:signal transduction histidine kinase